MNMDAMNIGAGIDPSPLITNNGEPIHNASLEQDDAFSSACATLTDFQKTHIAHHSASWRHPIRSINAYLTRLSSVFSWKVSCC